MHESSLHFTAATMNNTNTTTDPKHVFVAPYHPDTKIFRYTVARDHDRIKQVDPHETNNLARDRKVAKVLVVRLVKGSSWAIAVRPMIGLPNHGRYYSKKTRLATINGLWPIIQTTTQNALPKSYAN